MDAIAFQGRQLPQHTQLKKKMFSVDCMLEMALTSPTDSILRRDLEGMRDMLIFHYLSVDIEKPRYRVISFTCTH